MEQYDRDASGQLEFNEFLMMFRDELLDLREIMDYIQLNPARGGKGPASGWPRSDRLVEVGCADVRGVDQEQVRLVYCGKSRSCKAASFVLGTGCGFGRQSLPDYLSARTLLCTWTQEANVLLAVNRLACVGMGGCAQEPPYCPGICDAVAWETCGELKDAMSQPT